MGLLQRLKHDLKVGLATLRHGTAQAAIRALEETELLRIRLEIRGMSASEGLIFAREANRLSGFCTTLKSVDSSKRSKNSKTHARSLNRK